MKLRTPDVKRGLGATSRDNEDEPMKSPEDQPPSTAGKPRGKTERYLADSKICYFVSQSRLF